MLTRVKFIFMLFLEEQKQKKQGKPEKTFKAWCLELRSGVGFKFSLSV